MIANSYEALTLEACQVEDAVMDMFDDLIPRFPNLTIREIAYLATAAIHLRASEQALMKAVKMRQAERSNTVSTTQTNLNPSRG